MLVKLRVVAAATVNLMVGLRQSVTGSGATVIDLSLGPNIKLTVAAATTLSFTNTPVNGYAQRVVLNVINGGAFVLTWPTTRWAGSGGVVGSAPTLQAAGEDKVVLDISNTGGIIYDGSYIGRVA